MHSTVPHTADSPGKRSGWRGTCIALALASCAALLSACGARYEAPLTVGTNTWTGYEPLYLARDLGLPQLTHLRKVSIEGGKVVEVRLFSSNQAQEDAFWGR
mgnify:CR=1 FL=1